MSTDEYCIWTRKSCYVCLEEITNMDVDAWSTELPGILFDDRLALRANLEGLDLQMRKLQTSLDRHTACTKAYIPKYTMLCEVQSLKGE